MMTKRRTQEERKTETMRDLVRAAVVVFARKGYQRTTLSEVAEHAGYTAGLVNHRFGSKLGLLRAMIDYLVVGFFEQRLAESRSAGSADEAMRNYVATYLIELAENQSGLRALYAVMGEALAGSSEIAADVADFDERVRQHAMGILEDGVKSGEFPSDIDVRAIAILITGLIRGVAIQYLTSPKAFDVKPMIPAIQQTVIDMIH